MRHGSILVARDGYKLLLPILIPRKLGAALWVERERVRGHIEVFRGVWGSLFWGKAYLDKVPDGGGAEACEQRGGPLCGHDMSCAGEERVCLKRWIDLDARLDDVDCCGGRVEYDMPASLREASTHASCRHALPYK